MNGRAFWRWSPLMIYIDDRGDQHIVKLLGRNGPWAYVEMPNGTTMSVHTSTLREPDTKPKPPRFIPNPEPYRTPKKAKGAKS